MKKATTLTMDHSLFSGETIGEVSILTFKKTPLLHIADLERVLKSTLLCIVFSPS